MLHTSLQRLGGRALAARLGHPRGEQQEVDPRTGVGSSGVGSPGLFTTTKTCVPLGAEGNSH